MQNTALQSSTETSGPAGPLRRPGLVVAVTLLVVSSVLVASVPGAASDGSVPVESAVDGTREPTASFAADAFEDHRGDVVELVVVLGGSDAATVRVGGGDDFAATLVVRDENGDGRVVVRFNTYLANPDDPRTFEAAGEDDATVRNGTSADGPLAAGDYRLSVVAGTDAHATADDTATLRLQARSTDEVVVWTAPGTETSNLASRQGIEEAKRSDALQRRETLTKRDVLVLELRASGLSGALAAQDGPNATARFVDLLDEPPSLFDRSAAGVALWLWEKPDSVDLEQDAAVFDPTAPGAITVVPDPANDTYYLVVDLEETPLREDTYARLEAGDAFDVEFVVGNESDLSDDREVASGEFGLVEPAATILGAEPMYVDPAPNATIAGETTLPRGYTVTVDVVASGVDYRAERTVTVGEDGRFEATFDFASVPEGTALNVQVRYRGRDLFERPVDGVVRTVAADVEVLDVRRDELVTVEVNATLGVGGYVVLHANDSDGRLLGRSVYLAPGTHPNVTVPVDGADTDVERVTVVLYRDDDKTFDEHDVPYYVDGSPVTATAEVPLRTAPSTPPQSPTPTPDPSTPTATSTPNGPATETSTESPGFGAVPTIVVVAILLGTTRKRRDR